MVRAGSVGTTTAPASTRSFNTLHTSSTLRPTARAISRHVALTVDDPQHAEPGLVEHDAVAVEIVDDAGSAVERREHGLDREPVPAELLDLLDDRCDLAPTADRPRREPVVLELEEAGLDSEQREAHIDAAGLRAPRPIRPGRSELARPRPR